MGKMRPQLLYLVTLNTISEGIAKPGYVEKFPGPYFCSLYHKNTKITYQDLTVKGRHKDVQGLAIAPKRFAWCF
jgi:hypothetical protein